VVMGVITAAAAAAEEEVVAAGGIGVRRAVRTTTPIGLVDREEATAAVAVGTAASRGTGPQPGMPATADRVATVDRAATAARRDHTAPPPQVGRMLRQATASPRTAATARTSGARCLRRRLGTILTDRERVASNAHVYGHSRAVSFAGIEASRLFIRRFKNEAIGAI
jgi:hypothetical protein